MSDIQTEESRRERLQKIINELYPEDVEEGEITSGKDFVSQVLEDLRYAKRRVKDYLGFTKQISEGCKCASIIAGLFKKK